MKLFSDEELIGTRFGKLIIKSFLPTIKGLRKCLVDCDCGTKNKMVTLSNLRSKTKSCGCWYETNERKIIIKHGMIDTPEYFCWNNAKDRCLNPKNIKYKNYGGAGIIFHPSFRDFQIFFNEVGLRPGPEYSLDRKDTYKGYEPGNLKWSLIGDQNLNRKPIENKSSKFRGVYWRKDRNKWQAQIRIQGEKAKNLGQFDNELDAVEVYLEKYYNHYKRFPPEWRPVSLKGL